MDSLMGKFVEIFNRDSDWSRCHKHARRAGLMIFLHPNRDEDWVTGVKWDPEVFVRQPGIDDGVGFEGYSPVAWRKDFVERVVALKYVPNLEEYPSVSDRL